ncbi:AAA family ATPase [Paenibacillus sp. SGZ-1009]|uniref:AAA family ATPase n=1 Tax=Paenibacillus campi TaxID=3106031 RepID=UPI002AFE5F15|nr:AAA family ATPase [Paenibacillus sp. SGZ-1009]
MITEIHLKNRASYNNNGAKLTDLKAVNFIYGSNGSGKTTISNVIRNQHNLGDCKINWKDNTTIKTLVYNRDFVEENFKEQTLIKGIFTLGKESIDTKQAIHLKQTQLTKTTEGINRLKVQLNEQRKEVEGLEENFEENCWRLKTTYSEFFSEAFTGYRNSKKNFKSKLINELNNSQDLKSLEELKSLSSKIYTENKTMYNVLQKIEIKEISSLISDVIWKTSIVGKTGIDIAQLIERFNLSDWVKKGHNYLKETEDICPFCQQTIAQNFKSNLENYFDQTYEINIRKLQNISGNYNSLITQLLASIDVLISNECEYIPRHDLNLRKEVLEKMQNLNQDKILQKINEPSIIIQLDYFDEELNNINHIIEQCNIEIISHNSIVANISSEKSDLNAKIWRYIVNENSLTYRQYKEDYDKKDKIIKNMELKIKQYNDKVKELQSEIESLEQTIISTSTSVYEMNNLLKGFNFTNFQFAETQDKGSYSIIRSNGENAEKTLSEGEKTFVTFLYFISLLKGSTERGLITENKIVVIDDPISSLDSNILFIISNLIRRMIEDMRTKNSDIQQIFILTHNIYFHKEISFKKAKTALKDETFWVVRKIDNNSEVEFYSENPIKNSYELLWQEVKHASQRSSTTIQNLIRKIIENYFKVYGNYSEDDIIKYFEEEDKVICKTLLSWVNDGSHFTNDDLYIECTSDTVSKYLIIFEAIFEKTGHHAHYKMMMGEE